MIPSVSDDKLKRNQKEIIQVVLECQSCHSERARDFNDGDFIYKADEKPCDKCGGTLFVRQIYSEIVPKKKAKAKKESH
jgi:hypothetical protein